MPIYYPRCYATLHIYFDGGLGKDEHALIAVTPKAASVHLNGYHEADTWEMEFDARFLPFSPDIIRSAQVEIYMFGMENNLDDPGSYVNEKTLLVAGLADNCTFEVSSSGRSFKMDGRDLTCLLTDRPWQPDQRVNSGKDLKGAVQEILDKAVAKDKQPLYATIDPSVGGDPQITKGVIPQNRSLVHHGKTGKSHLGTLTTQHHRKRGVTFRGGQYGKSYWDVIYELCLKFGLIAFVRGNKVIITTPQDITRQSVDAIRRVTYGTNLASLKAERHMAKDQVPTIIATSYDPATRKKISVQYPLHPKEIIQGVGTKKDTFQYITPRVSITDKKLLRKYAETYYNNLARGEYKIHITTKNLTDLDGRDLIQLRAGDPLFIGFDAFNLEEFHQLSIPERTEHLIAEGYDQDVAIIVAHHYEQMAEAFQKPFYTKECTVSWSNTEGLAIEAELMNYVSVERDDPALHGDTV